MLKKKHIIKIRDWIQLKIDKLNIYYNQTYNKYVLK
jgi:hypothetical protein